MLKTLTVGPRDENLEQNGQEIQVENQDFTLGWRIIGLIRLSLMFHSTQSNQYLPLDEP